MLIEAVEMAASFPSQVQLEAAEIEQVNEARLALRLHRLPQEIRAAPARDIANLIAMMVLEDKMQAEGRKAG